MKTHLEITDPFPTNDWTEIDQSGPKIAEKIVQSFSGYSKTSDKPTFFGEKET